MTKRLAVVLMLMLPVATAAQQTSGVSQQPERPKPEGSMVGYIDNAIVGTQLRIRFDAGYHAAFPDKAEFFYGKCGCYQDLTGPAGDPGAPGPEAVVTDLRFQELRLNAEFAAHKKISLLVELPLRWIQAKSFSPAAGSFPNQQGLGDILAGVKLGLVASEDRRHLTLQFRVQTPSGEASRGLGTGHTSIEPALLYYERLSPRFALESEFALWHPFGGSPGVASASDPDPRRFAGDILFYGVGPSYQLYKGDRVRFGPVLELAGWHILHGYQTVWSAPTPVGEKIDGTDIVNLKAGVRTSIGDRNSIYVGYGRALTDAVWYKDIVRVEYRRLF
jgi:Putative MetA-pathway of phenol degradation